MKFSICNLGCKVNNYEANWYRQKLSEKYEETEFGNQSDIIIINSCTVTNTAGSKTRQMLHKARRNNPDSCIVVVGCYVQVENNLSLFEDADILIGSNHKLMLPQLVEQFLNKREKIVMVEEFEHCDFEQMVINQFNQTRAYLKIQDGCNQFCAYCVIPLARGRERCLPADECVKQAQLLVDSGHKEIVLTGIHTGRYHDGDIDLAGLMKRLLAEVKGLERLRISSIEMNEVSEQLIDLLANDKRIARHLHIPLQVGNDRILKANRRPYSMAMYKEKIEYIRSKVADISISSDVMVGLPTESDEDFKLGMDYIKDIKLSFMHVFPYSPKKHTDAALFKGQVDESIKKKRVGELTKLSAQLYNDYIKNFVGHDSEVIVERYIDGTNVGHNSEYINVRFDSSTNYAHQLVNVKILEAKEDYLIGTVE